MASHRLLVLLLHLTAILAWAPGPARVVAPPGRLATLAVRRPRAKIARVRFDANNGPPDPKDRAGQALEAVRGAGLAGGISYFVVELGFFAIALPVGYFAWHASSGVWLDPTLLLGDGEGEGKAELVALLVGYVLLLKTLLPLRLGATLLLTPRVKTLLSSLGGGAD